MQNGSEEKQIKQFMVWIRYSTGDVDMKTLPGYSREDIKRNLEPMGFKVVRIEEVLEEGAEQAGSGCAMLPIITALLFVVGPLCWRLLSDALSY